MLDVILNEVFRSGDIPQVFVNKFSDKKPDVSQGCANSANYSNFFDAMEILNPVIANILLYEKEVEHDLLIKTTLTEAWEVMSDERIVAKNTKKVITLNGEVI